MHKGLPGFLATFIVGFSVFWFGDGLAQSLEDPADPCADERNWRVYRVAAIDVKMVLNRFGDRDDNAFMYILDKNIEAIGRWENYPGCTSWNKPGEPSQHQSCVSTGLRDDLVQPLVLRANLGQCVVIHLTNRLSPTKGTDPNPPNPLLARHRKWPNDGKASLDVSGLAYTAEQSGLPVSASDASVKTYESITYKIPLPADPNAERAYYFQDGGGNRQRVAHGLFGVIVAEPAGSEYLDPQTGKLSDGSGWEAIIQVPEQRDFREFVLIYHEVGDEDYQRIVRGTGNNQEAFLPQLTSNFEPLDETYRPAGRAINYRSEPFLHRLAIDGDIFNSSKSPYSRKKALAYSSYTFGDPATPIPRSYLGEPTKTRLVHGGSEVFHVHHLHGGGDRWRRSPKSDPNNDITSGLNKRPEQNVLSTHLDSQTIGPGTSYNLEHECGAGGCQQAAGDFLYHCHIGQHYIGGMWGLWRVFDTLQKDLAKLPDMPDPPEAVDSTRLIGRTFGGKTVVAEADPGNPAQVSLKDWIESQLPSQGRWLDDDDATVWDWTAEQRDGALLYMGEPETLKTWVNYSSDQPGKRPLILFNPDNGRYAWPLFRPHLGQRPPFAPNGHSGAPWLGENGSEQRRDGLCPDPDEWNIPYQAIRYYPISAIPIDVPRNDENSNDIDPNGKIFILNEDIRGATGDGKKILLSRSKTIEPLVIRSNVGDCVRVILTSKLPLNEDVTGSKVNMHTHFVQFDPQASDGVITGFSFEQSVRPYGSEKQPEGEGPANEQQPRGLTVAAPAGAQEITVNQVYRLTDPQGKPRTGLWIGVGLGEGILDESNSCPVPGRENLIPRTEIRRILDIQPSPDHGFTIRLDQPLALPHEAGEAVGVEFVQYLWYSDVDAGTVFWHDHVDFNSWGHGLASAHVIEPERSTWHDPKTGKPVRSGAIVDIHVPPGTSVGTPDQQGSFREFVLLNIKEQLGDDFFGESKATINLRREPIDSPFKDPTETRGETGRQGEQGELAYSFSSVKHGDPATPLPHAYVGDPFVIRHLGVVDREGGIRVTGHRFRLERHAPEGELSDGSPIGISERFDLVFDGGAGGPAGNPGDFLYYNTIGRDMLGGAWGLIRVHDTRQDNLMPLPDRPVPPGGKGFPTQVAARTDNSSAVPDQATEPGNPCPWHSLEKVYDVQLGQTSIMLQGGRSGKPTVVVPGVAYRLKNQPADFSVEPLVLRVNEGDCLVVNFTNELPDHRAGLQVGELLFDPQGSHGSAIGLNLDSTVGPGETTTYRYFADRELGTVIALDLANPTDAAKGAFAAVVVEPKGSEYRDPLTGSPVDTGVMADIIGPKGKFRELVTLFHDSDPKIGANAMRYAWEAHCKPLQSDCNRDLTSVGFTSISYTLNPWRDRDAYNAPADVFRKIQGDPGLVVTGPPGLPLMFRVAAPWGEQLHVFSLSGHHWPLEPALPNSEQVFAQLLAPGYAFDAPVIGGFGGEYEITGDFLFRDARMPFTEAGLWGLIRVKPEEAPK